MRSALTALLLLATVGAAPAAGQLFVPTGRDTLRALPGVEVIVESVPAVLARAGITHDALIADVVRDLEAAGIVVYRSQAANPSPAKAYLDVRATVLTLPKSGGSVIALQLQLRQTLTSLVTESRVVNAATWESGTLVTLPARDLALLRAEVAGLVQEFVKDWRAAH